MKVKLLIFIFAVHGFISFVSAQQRRKICKLVTRESVTVKVERNKFTIDWSRYFRRDCPLDTYKYYDPTLGLNQSISELPIEIKNLTAGTQYNFTLFDDRYKTEIFTLEFTTKETLFAVMKSGPDVEVNGTDLIVYVNKAYTTSNYDPNYYRVEYKEEKESKWELVERGMMPPPATVLITSLKANTLYQVRTLLLFILDTMDNTTYGYFGENVPYTSATTTCLPVAVDDLQIKTGHDSITIYWMLNNASCLPDYYAYNISNGETNLELEQPEIKIQNLDPGIEYVFDLFEKKTQNLVLRLNLKTRGEHPLNANTFSAPPYLNESPKIQKCLTDGFILSLNTNNVKYIDVNISKVALQYKVSGDSIWTTNAYFPWPTENMTLRGLNNETEYQIRAVLILNDDTGELSDILPVLISSLCSGADGISDLTIILLISLISLVVVIIIITLLLVFWCKKNHVFFNNEIYDYKNRTSISTSMNRSYQNKVDDDDGNYQFEEIQGIMLTDDNGSDNE